MAFESAVRVGRGAKWLSARLVGIVWIVARSLAVATTRTIPLSPMFFLSACLLFENCRPESIFSWVLRSTPGSGIDWGFVVFLDTHFITILLIGTPVLALMHVLAGAWRAVRHQPQPTVSRLNLVGPVIVAVFVLNFGSPIEGVEATEDLPLPRDGAIEAIRADGRCPLPDPGAGAHHEMIGWRFAAGDERCPADIWVDDWGTVTCAWPPGCPVQPE